MKAKDVMARPVVSVAPDTDVRKIARLLLGRRISAVPVINDRGRVIGMVSEGDLMRRPESRTEGRASWWLDLLHGLAARRPGAGRSAAPKAARIRDGVAAGLREAGLRSEVINVVVEDAAVHLWGWVESAAQRRAAALAAARTPGVKKVENHLAVLTPRLMGTLGAE